MKKCAIITAQLLVANLAILFCIGLASFLPAPWTGTGGRSWGPQVLYAAIFVMATSVLLRYKLDWPGLRMVLFLAEGLSIEKQEAKTAPQVQSFRFCKHDLHRTSASSAS